MRELYAELAASVMATAALLSTIDGWSDDDRVRAYCLSGSVLGSFAYILLSRLYKTEQLDVVATFFGNSIVGFLFSPILCEWAGVHTTFSQCMAFSGGIGLGLPWFVSTLLPIISRKTVTAVKGMNFRALIARILNLKLDDDPRKDRDDRKGS